MTAVCMKCYSSCIIELDPDDFDEATSAAAGGLSSIVPDDLKLSCGCHFHWQCLLDDSPQIASSLTCPSCHHSISATPSGPSATNLLPVGGSQNTQILSCYINEGGVQDGLDILPLITEEAYLDANPAARPARAFMTMCSEGDVTGILELLTSQDNEDQDEELEESKSPAQILRYQDPLNGMKCALHLAVENSQEEIVWMLLWLASNLDSNAFPQEIVFAAQSLEADRKTATMGIDIRHLRNESGQVAIDIAQHMGGTWNILLQSGVLGS